ncbi:MAG TPA: YraN family protein [Bacteroidales bacterium]|jgi:putative endonuclease|nr:YraN family protein [Bacteroidales bacterium]
MKTDKQITGQQGEEHAVNFYLQNQYQILATNWVYGHLEIDIIACNQDTIVFCEVKTRTSDWFGTPEMAVNKAKQRNIIKAAHHYICKEKIDLDARFDIISVLIKGDQVTLEHLPGAFTPSW